VHSVCVLSQLLVSVLFIAVPAYNKNSKIFLIYLHPSQRKPALNSLHKHENEI